MRSLGPQVRGHLNLPLLSPRPLPRPCALPPASPARLGRCFYPAEPSPTRVAACSRELIPAGRSRLLRAALGEHTAPPPPTHTHLAPRSHPSSPAPSDHPFPIVGGRAWLQGIPWPQQACSTPSARHPTTHSSPPALPDTKWQTGLSIFQAPAGPDRCSPPPRSHPSATLGGC